MIGAKKQCKYGDNVYVVGDAGDGVLRAPVMMIMLMVVKMAMIELVYSGGSKKGVKPDMFLYSCDLLYKSQFSNS